MTDLAMIAAISIFTAGFTIAIGAIGPALGEGSRSRDCRHRPATGCSPDLVPDAICESGDD